MVLKRIPIDVDGIDQCWHEVELWYAMDSPFVVKLVAATHCNSPTLLILENAEKTSTRWWPPS